MGYTASFSQGVTFTPDNGAGVILNVRGKSWEEMVTKIATTHTGSGGLAACIAGILDGNGNVQAGVDNVALPSNVGIRAGRKGTITFAIGSQSPFSVHVMVVKVHYQGQIDGMEEYNFDVAMDSTSGAYTYPN